MTIFLQKLHALFMVGCIHLRRVARKFIFDFEIFARCFERRLFNCITAQVKTAANQKCEFEIAVEDGDIFVAHNASYGKGF